MKFYSAKRQLREVHAMPKRVMNIAKKEFSKFGKSKHTKQSIDSDITKDYKVLGKSIKKSIPILAGIYGAKVAVVDTAYHAYKKHKEKHK
jgi:hypothetical protein